jgi:CGNR zinc finger
MSHDATERAGLRPAPDGLALVQDLLNTRAIGQHGTELLGSVDEVRRWLRKVLDPPAADPHIKPDVIDREAADLSWVDDLSDRDRRVLLDLRSDLERLISGGGTLDTDPTLIRTTMVVNPAGELILHPAGRGPGWFISAVWVQVYLAQQAGTWRRLKLCHNPPCGSAFYDGSKNNSGVWHDVRVCGNAVNLRASRARRRASAGESPAR